MVTALDARVTLGVLALAVGIGASAGALPTLMWRGTDLPALLGRASVATAGGAPWLLRLLTSSQVACSMASLVAAQLAWASFVNLRAVSPGFRSEGLAIVTVAAPRFFKVKDADLTQVFGFFESVLDGARRLPGVVAVAATTNLPIQGSVHRISLAAAEARPTCEYVQVRGVSHEYFRTLELPVIEGRTLVSGDDLASGAEGQNVVVVNRTLATRCWPGQSAVGRTLTLPIGTWRVVGVVGDVRVFGRRRPVPAEVYLPMSRFVFPSMYVLLRIGDERQPAASGPLRRLVATLDPEARVSSVRTIEQIISEAEAPLTLRARLLTAATVCSLVIAAVGVYATCAFTAHQRRREPAIRLALGASPRGLLWRGTSEAVAWALPGLLVGGALGYWAGLSLAPVLFGVMPFEPWTYVGSAWALTVLVGTAAWWGSRQVFDADLWRALHLP